MGLEGHTMRAEILKFVRLRSTRFRVEAEEDENAEVVFLIAPGRGRDCRYFIDLDLTEGWSLVSALKTAFPWAAVELATLPKSVCIVVRPRETRAD